MKRVIIPVVIAATLTLVPYVRREWRAPRADVENVVGSRDRALHGKARRRARRTA